MTKIAHSINEPFKDCLKLADTIFLFFIQDINDSGSILLINLFF